MNHHWTSRKDVFWGPQPSPWTRLPDLDGHTILRVPAGHDSPSAHLDGSVLQLNMRIEEPSSPGAEEGFTSPVYWVDFWELTPGLELEGMRIHDAIDYREVEAWASKHRPHQYTIYVEDVLSETRSRLLRVGGFEPYADDGPIESYISDPEEAREVSEAVNRGLRGHPYNPSTGSSPYIES